MGNSLFSTYVPIAFSLWIKNAVIVISVAFGFSLVFSSCHSKNKTTQCEADESIFQRKDSIGKFVYQDDNMVIHISDVCFNLLAGKDVSGHKIYAKHPIDTTEFVFSSNIRVCSNCVSEAEFVRLKAISIRNEEFDIRRRWLYDKLKQSDVIWGSYDLFINHLSNPIERREIYEKACNEGYNVGEYDEFARLLGIANGKLNRQ